MASRKRSCWVFLLLFAFIFTMLAACSGRGQDADESPAAPTPLPSPIPTTAPDRAVLALPADVSEADRAEAQALVAELAASSGLEFEVREEIFANEISPDVKMAVFLSQPDNLGSLAAGAPSTQFIALSDQDWNPPGNVTIIRKNDGHAAFLSGYLAAMLAPDFRVGAMLAAENGADNQAFVNGVRYFCGLCAAKIFPLNTYPVVTQQPAGSAPAVWQGAFNELYGSKLNVVYLAPEALTPELAAYLATADVAFIGTQSPPQEIQPRWVATVNLDGLSPIREVWNDALSGNGGRVESVSLKILDVNIIEVEGQYVWLSQGKMQLLDKVIELLRDGQIYPYTVTP